MNDKEKTKEDLKKELALYKSALERTQDISGIGTWELDLHTSYSYWSNESYRILETTENKSSKDLLEFYKSLFNDPVELEKFYKSLNSLKKSGTNYSIEHSIVTPQGKHKFIRSKAKPVTDDKGKVVKIQGILQDITKEKEHDKRYILQKLTLLKLSRLSDKSLPEILKEITKLSSKALNVERVGIWRFMEDESGIICKSLFKRTESVHESGHFLNSKDHPNYFKALKKGITISAEDAQADSRTKELTANYLKPYGINSMLDVLIKEQGGDKDIGIICFEHVKPMKKWTEEEQNFALSIANITSLAFESFERKQSEQKLMKLSEMQSIILKIALKYINMPHELAHRSIINSLKELGEFVQVDRAYVFEYDWKNKVCNNTHEWCKDGISAEIDNSQNIPIKALDNLVEAHKKGDEVSIENVMNLPANKGLRQILESQGIKSVLTIPMMKNNKCIGFIGFDSVRKIRKFNKKEKTLLKFFSEMLVNVNNKKELEKDLVKAKEKAEESDKSKSAFLSNMSHEIRTPMNAILGFSNLLKKKNLSEEKKDQYLEFIEFEGKNLLNLISDIIDFSKIEANQLTVKNEPCDLNKLIDKKIQKFNVFHTKNNCEIIASKGLPDRHSIISTDVNRLSQILANLLDNALKFTEKGKIEIGYTLNGDVLEFFVKDSGQGIEKKFHDSIFDRFRQADNDYTKSISGTGLGLSIVKNLTELLGGEVWFNSEFNKGTTFWFTIPYIKSKKRTVKKLYQMLLKL